MKKQLELEVQKKLFELQDEKYKNFNSALIPNVLPANQIGIRIPVLRKFAKEFAKTSEAEEFIKILPHRYFDENNLHGFIIETEKDFDAALKKTEAFLPYIDNWGTCDMVSPKAFKQNLPELLKHIKKWLKSDHAYTVRFAVGMLMKWYLDINYDEFYPKMVSKIKSNEYYINMMIAWYFATALAKQPKSILPYFTEKRLGVWCHNKAIQKCLESLRIPQETKTLLKTLKIK